MAKPDSKLEREFLRELVAKEPIDHWGEMGESSCTYCLVEVDRVAADAEMPVLPHKKTCAWFRAYQYAKKRLK